jgi:hypothetical protein
MDEPTIVIRELEPIQGPVWRVVYTADDRPYDHLFHAERLAQKLSPHWVALAAAVQDFNREQLATEREDTPDGDSTG